MPGIKRTAADKKLSDYIRWERDQGRCQRCGKQYVRPSNALHAMHMFGRRCARCTAKHPKPHDCTRLDPDNLLAGCYGCHQHLDSHPYEKESLWRNNIGDEKFDALAARANRKRDRTSRV